jgi:hypothetical protein
MDYFRVYRYTGGPIEGFCFGQDFAGCELKGDPIIAPFAGRARPT